MKQTYITTKQAARKLGVSKYIINQMCYKGKLEYRPRPIPKSPFFIKYESVQRLANPLKTPPEESVQKTESKPAGYLSRQELAKRTGLTPGQINGRTTRYNKTGKGSETSLEHIKIGRLNFYPPNLSILHPKIESTLFDEPPVNELITRIMEDINALNRQLARR